ncbi:MAG TPA: hypothetical protein VF681_03575 [Abditibacteriaceae bacterium]|jgi:hypothetical protein
MENRKWTKEEIIKQANESIVYYQQFADNGDSSMWLGLYMSQQWRKLLDERHPDLNELKLFAKALENNGNFHGSQWLHMSIIVKYWVEDIEQEGEVS